MTSLYSLSFSNNLWEHTVGNSSGMCITPKCCQSIVEDHLLGQYHTTCLPSYHRFCKQWGQPQLDNGKALHGVIVFSSYHILQWSKQIICWGRGGGDEGGKEDLGQGGGIRWRNPSNKMSGQRETA